jgi:hypothetical protein
MWDVMRAKFEIKNTGIDVLAIVQGDYELKCAYRSSCKVLSPSTNLLKSIKGSSGLRKFKWLTLLGSVSFCLTTQMSEDDHPADLPRDVEFRIERCGGEPIPVPGWMR